MKKLLWRSLPTTPSVILLIQCIQNNRHQRCLFSPCRTDLKKALEEEVTESTYLKYQNILEKTAIRNEFPFFWHIKRVLKLPVLKPSSPCYQCLTNADLSFKHASLIKTKQRWAFLSISRQGCLEKSRNRAAIAECWQHNSQLQCY